MLVGTLSLCNLFDKNVHHIVPLFQRPYVWEREKQWEPLWDDTRRIAERLLTGQPVRSHFLGASVHEKKAVPPGAIETRLVIDGQQRLTTLQILLQAFEDVAATLGLDMYRAALRNLTRNNHPLRQGPPEDFKIWPTNADRSDFRTTMQAGSPQALRSALALGLGMKSAGRQIPDAYLFFADVIGGWVGANDAANRVQALYSALYEHIRLVVIDLDQQDDAQLIFETLNARGTPLLAADLVKNALLQEAATAKLDPQDLYEQHWRPFDQDAAYWRKNVGRGPFERPRIDIYLQHYLTMQLRDEVPAAHLYIAFKDYLNRAHRGLSQHFASLAKYARIYRRLGEAAGEGRARLFLQRLAAMDVGTAYPFLLAAFDRPQTDPSRLEAILVLVEAYLVRRMVCRLTTKGYHKLFIDLLDTVVGPADDIPARVRRKLASRTAEVDRWPADAEFHQAWVNNPLYENLSRPRLRMLLEAMERGLRGGKLAETEHVPSGLTVEHIMPRSWEEHWPLPADVPAHQASARRQRLLHTIGNLTLLSEQLNTSISNGAWAASNGVKGKREAIAKHTVLHLNKQVCELTVWSEAEIERRSEALFVVAQAIWPGQTSAQASLAA